MSLQAKLDAFKPDFGASKPPNSVPRSVIDTMHWTADELIASGAAGRALKAGDMAPSFVLNGARGRPVSSAKLLGQGPLVVSFYRGGVVPILQYGAPGAAGGTAELPPAGCKPHEQSRRRTP